MPKEATDPIDAAQHISARYAALHEAAHAVIGEALGHRVVACRIWPDPTATRNLTVWRGATVHDPAAVLVRTVGGLLSDTLRWASGFVGEAIAGAAHSTSSADEFSAVAMRILLASAIAERAGCPVMPEALAITVVKVARQILERDAQLWRAAATHLRHHEYLPRERVAALFDRIKLYDLAKTNPDIAPLIALPLPDAAELRKLLPAPASAVANIVDVCAVGHRRGAA